MTGPLLIVNADDFGLTPGLCQAILRAGSCGIVTSTSALANGPGASARRGVAAGFRARRRRPPGVGGPPGPGAQRPGGAVARRPARGPPAELAAVPHPLRARSGRPRRRAARVRRAGGGAAIERPDPHAPRHPPEPPPLAEHRARHRRAGVLERRGGDAGHAFRGTITDRARRAPLLPRPRVARRKANVRFPSATAGFDESGRLDLAHLRGAIERFAALGVSSAELVCHPGAQLRRRARRARDGTTAAKTSSTRCVEEARVMVERAGFRLGTFADLATTQPAKRETRR